MSCQIQNCPARYNTVAVIDLDDSERIFIRLCQQHGDRLERGACSFRPVTGGAYEMQPAQQEAAGGEGERG